MDTAAPNPKLNQHVAGRIKGLDGLRGVAAIMVIVAHLEFLLGEQKSPILTFLNNMGPFGVQLFYALSGFAIAFALDHRSNEPIRSFYIRRYFRIAPLWYLAVAWAFIHGFPRTWYWAPRGTSTVGIVMVILMVHGTTPDTINNVVSLGWSVGTEVLFYIIAPLLCGWVTSCLRATLLLCGAFAVTFGTQYFAHAYIVPMYPPNAQYIASYYFDLLSLPAELPLFCTGIFAFQLWKRGIIGRSRTFLRLPLAIFAIATCAAATYLTREDGYSWAYLLMTLASFAIIWSATLPGTRFLSHPYVVYLGTISYGLYLFHLRMMDLVIDWDHGVLSDTFRYGRYREIPFHRGLPELIAAPMGFATVLIVSVVFASLIHFTLEAPMQRLGARIASACAAKARRLSTKLPFVGVSRSRSL